MITTLAEGVVTITATAGEISFSKKTTISDRPNLYVYKSGSATVNDLIKSLSISLYNLEQEEPIFIEKVEIYENDRLFTTYSANTLESNGIKTTVSPYASWQMSLTFKLGIWGNKSKVVITVRSKSNKTYQPILNI